MARPRIFVSSTYYDLKHIRNNLENFIDTLGYESVLFESGDIPFHHDSPLDESCYAEIVSCHIFVLIIGGRYGSPSSAEQKPNQTILRKYNSITKKEYETAREKEIPIYIFIEKNVLSEYQTFKRNRANTDTEYAHVDSVQIFHLIDEIYSQPRNNQIKDFEKFDEISTWLKDQWAGLFADLISKKSHDAKLQDMSSQIHELKQINNTLIKYTESIMEKVEVKDARKIITAQEKKISESKANSLMKEPMIKYLSEKYKLKHPPIKTMELLLKSQTIEEFLEKCGVPQESSSEFMSNFETEATRDFIELSEKYAPGN